jgi:hypothetical protein
MFKTLNTIPAGGVIKVVYPPQVKLVSSKFSCVLNVASAATTCEQNEASRTLYVKNSFAFAFSGGGNVTLNLNGMQNSEFAVATDSFNVLTLTAAVD